MITYRGLDELTLGESHGDFGLALGVFDGFHLGHQAVINAARGCGRVGVLTFSPHPAEVLAPGKAPRQIIGSLAHQKLILTTLQVDFFVIVEFTHEFSMISGPEFAQALLATGAKQLVAGHDWSFGKGRSGNIHLLKKWARDITVTAVDPVLIKGERASSSLIRSALSTEDLPKATHLLGRPYSVYGPVCRGKQLGRTIGFPTANVEVLDELLPPNGVYAISANWNGEWVPGVANVGVRPTVDDSTHRTLEVHLFSDHVPDHYDWMVEVQFKRKIREEQKFNGIDELKVQIALDITDARSF